MVQERGYVVYRGPSQIDGQPIVCIITFKSKNRKTGGLIQSWILLDNGKIPTDNVMTGNDKGICGDCIHRRDSCYVNVGQAPNKIYRTYLSGKYPDWNRDKNHKILEGKTLRLGSYGDPAAVPLEFWKCLIYHVSNWVGYTHQWRQKKFSDFRRYCMASVETNEQANIAHAMLWRTFRVKLASQIKTDNEFICPASEEGGFKKTCEECKACRGFNDNRPNVPSVVINVHGLAWKATKYEKSLERAGLLPLPMLVLEGDKTR